VLYPDVAKMKGFKRRMRVEAKSFSAVHCGVTHRRILAATSSSL
jgi:hypothetical protein